MTTMSASGNIIGSGEGPRYLDPYSKLYCCTKSKKCFRLSAVAYSKRYSKILEYEYRVKTAALSYSKRYSILSLTLYLE
jgi:hypothetical protein